MTFDSDLTLFRINDLVPLLKRCRTAILKDVREGRFPAPIKLGARARAWRRQDVLDHINGLGATATTP